MFSEGEGNRSEDLPGGGGGVGRRRLFGGGSGGGGCGGEVWCRGLLGEERMGRAGFEGKAKAKNNIIALPSSTSRLFARYFLFPSSPPLPLFDLRTPLPSPRFVALLTFHLPPSSRTSRLPPALPRKGVAATDRPAPGVRASMINNPPSLRPPVNDRQLGPLWFCSGEVKRSGGRGIDSRFQSLHLRPDPRFPSCCSKPKRG